MLTVLRALATPHIVNPVKIIFICTLEIILVWLHVRWDFMRNWWQNRVWNVLQVANLALTRLIALLVFRMWLLWHQLILVLLLVHLDIMVIPLLQLVRNAHLNAWHANQPQPTASAVHQDTTSSNYLILSATANSHVLQVTTHNQVTVMNVHSHVKHVQHHQNVLLVFKALIIMQIHFRVYWTAPHQHSTTILTPHVRAVNIHAHRAITTQHIVSVVHSRTTGQYCTCTMANVYKHALLDTILMTLGFVINVMDFV